MVPDPALVAEEDRSWRELHELVDTLTPDEVDRPGYYVEGWTAKDLLAHIGSWLAEGGAILERIRSGTYRREEIDVDALNEVFFRAQHDVSFADVHAQAFAARNQMLAAWGSLREPSADADWWIRKAGPDHYDEHLPRLREWVAQLRNDVH